MNEYAIGIHQDQFSIKLSFFLFFVPTRTYLFIRSSELHFPFVKLSACARRIMTLSWAAQSAISKHHQRLR